MTVEFKDPITHELLNILQKQERKGIDTYGHTLADCPVEAYDWQTMLIEELIDGLKYSIKENLKLKQEILQLKSIGTLIPNINYEDKPKDPYKERESYTWFKDDRVKLEATFTKPPYADLDD